jgi:LuxR family maltose regulon positive regulatory protein
MSGLSSAQNKLIEPLTRREVEIVKLLVTDLSIVEISDELCISVNTHRTHIKHVYEKLGIHNRMGVVTRGRELGLL